MKVAFLTVMPSPYTEDLFAAMKDDGRIEPRVFYMEMSAPDTKWGERELPAYATQLDGHWVNVLGGRVHFNRRVRTSLRDSNADLFVVAGYSSVTCQKAMAWLRMTRRPWIFWGEIPGMRKLGLVGRTLRAASRWPAVRWPDAIAAVGSKAVDEYQKLSGNRCIVENIPYHCNMQIFADERTDRRVPPVGIRFLYCGQLIARKDVTLLLDSFLQIATKDAHSTLTFVGDGPLQPTMESMLPEVLKGRVRFAGFQPIECLPRFFAEADVFALPSRHDGWGVVVNQAIAAGLPVICSDAAGAGHDLVVEAQNGFRFAAGDQGMLTNCMLRFVKNPELVPAFSENSILQSERWSLERGVDRWYHLAHRVLDYRETRDERSETIKGESH